MRVEATNRNFERLARRLGLTVPSGFEDAEGRMVETERPIPPDDPLFETYLEDIMEFGGVGWVETAPNR